MDMIKPEFHFSPKRNWMNDPNGTLYKDSKYHLFYQYNPSGCDWGNICWAYAESEDLIQWKRKGIKLSPLKEIGERYCFSGCAVDRGDSVKLIYTSIGFEEDAVQRHAIQRIADCDPQFDEILRNGSIICDTVHPFAVAEWRDPFVFQFRQEYYMVMAALFENQSGALLYRAKDAALNEWEYVAPFYTIEGDIMECPNVAVFGDRVAVIYSTIRDRRIKYASGTFDGRQFQPVYEGILDGGKHSFYATNLSGSVRNETILYGWMGESFRDKTSPDGTYSGCLAIPRKISMTDEGRLEICPICSLTKLYKKIVYECDRGRQIEVNGYYPMARIGFTAEEKVEFVLQQGKDEGIECCFDGKTLTIKRRCLFGGAILDEETAEVPEAKQNTFDILLDKSAVEIFISGKIALTMRFYPTAPADKLFLLRSGEIKNLKAVEMEKADITGD